MVQVKTCPGSTQAIKLNLLKKAWIQIEPKANQPRGKNQKFNPSKIEKSKSRPEG